MIKSTEIKVKSYNYDLRNVGILYSVIFAVIGIFMITLSKNYTVILCAICIFFLL